MFGSSSNHEETDVLRVLVPPHYIQVIYMYIFIHIYTILAQMDGFPFPMEHVHVKLWRFIVSYHFQLAHPEIARNSKCITWILIRLGLSFWGFSWVTGVVLVLGWLGWKMTTKQSSAPGKDQLIESYERDRPIGSRKCKMTSFHFERRGSTLRMPT